jgi:hypothetical protein
VKNEIKSKEYVDIVFKIKHKLYIALGSTQHPTLDEKLWVHACTEMKISLDKISTHA